MGFRYRKSIRVGKYFRINASKSGIGYSFGMPGARITHSANGRVTTTVGLPGTGISYSTSHKNSNSTRKSNTTQHTNHSTYSNNTIGVYNSTEYADIDTLLPADFSDMSKAMKKAQTVDKAGKVLIIIGSILILPCFFNISEFWSILIIGLPLIIGGIAAKIYAHCALPVSIDYELDEESQINHMQRISAWKQFFSSSRNWQTISSAVVLNQKVNAGAAKSVNRVSVKLSSKAPFFIKSNVEIIVLKLKSEQIVVLPDKLLIIKGRKIGAANYDEVKILTSCGRFIEDGLVPKDAEIIGYTWQYVNKNGSPDRRYSNNRKIPVCLYGYVTIRSDSGLEIQLSCSDKSKISELSQLI